MSIPQLADLLRTEADAYLFLEDLRWNGRPVCPHCGSVRKPYFLTPRNGTSRTTRRGSASERRVWKCADCRKQFTVTVGTVFHASKIPLRTWLFIVFEMVSSKNGVSAREIERKYGLTPKSAWFALHRVRAAMERGEAVPFSGRVVADETFYGGKAANRHGHDPRQHRQGPTDDKVAIMALVSRETGEVRSRVIPNVKRDTLRKAIAEHVDMPNTHLHTDQLASYRQIAGDFAAHSAVHHGDREYVRGDVSTNQAESFFAQLKRSLDGTHHHVSREHLARYLAHFDFLYTTCKLTDTERMGELVSRVGGRRLAYHQPLTA